MQLPPATQSASELQNYHNLSALESMKYGDTKSAEHIEQVAKQFESMFVSMLLKSMREANKAFSEGNFLESSQGDFYQDMFDSQLSVSLSSGKGLGIADVIKRQLLDEQERAAGLALRPNSYSVSDYERDIPSTQLVRKELDKTIKQVEEILDTPQTNQESGNPAIDFSSPESFVHSLKPYADKVAQETGISANAMLAQAALETGWGKHQILGQDGSNSHNLFGIKANPSWQGDSTEILTTEYRFGTPVKERAAFRAYPSYEESFKDYANFLNQSDRYQDALALKDEPKAFAQALQNAGYATDPRYGAKLSSIIDRIEASVGEANNIGLEER